MIARHWKGVTYEDQADPYIRHLKEDTFKILGEIEGFVDVHVLRRNVDEGVEFIVISTWQSMEAIKAFAGDNPELAVVPDKARPMLRSHDQHVNHYEIVLEA